MDYFIGKKVVWENKVKCVHFFEIKKIVFAQFELVSYVFFVVNQGSYY
jgi:hypothetical protein